jgi:homoaconitase
LRDESTASSLCADLLLSFPYTPSMGAYLRATGREPVAQAADDASLKGFLAADEGAQYDELIEIVSSQ